MKKLFFISILCFFFFGCSSDEEDNNSYCWEWIQSDSEIASCHQGTAVVDIICDKTENEMKEFIKSQNDLVRKAYDEGKLDCLKVFSYKKSVK